MTYEQILARQPLSTVVGDRQAAKEFVAFLGVQIESGIGTLTDSQQRYLYRLRARWQVRADGKDPIWNAQGSRPGRPLGSGKKKRTTRGKSTYGHEEDHDPLLRSILGKFGTPAKLTEDDL